MCYVPQLVLVCASLSLTDCLQVQPLPQVLPIPNQGLHIGPEEGCSRSLLLLWLHVCSMSLSLCEACVLVKC